MAGPLPPGFTFDDEQPQAAPSSSSVLPPGFRFDDEPAPAPAPAQPANVPLPPRRPDDINALPDNPPPENPPLPPARPAELPVGNDYSNTDFPNPPQQGGGWVPDKLNSLFGTTDPSRLTPEQGQTAHDAKVAAARDDYLKAKQEAAAARARIDSVNTSNATGSLPTFDSGAGSPPLSGEDLADLAQRRADSAAERLVQLTGQPNPSLTPGRAAAEAAIAGAGHGVTAVAGLAGKVDRDLWGHPWLSEKVEGADKAIDSAFAGDPGRSDELGPRVAGAVGGMAPLLPIAAWSPAAAAVFSGVQGANSTYDSTEATQAEKRRPSVTLTNDEADNIARATAAKYPTASPEERKAQFTSAATSLLRRKQFDAEQNEATEGKQGVLGTNLAPQDYADIRSRVEKQNPKASEDQLGDLMLKEARALEHRKELTNRWLAAIGGGVIGAAQMAPFSRLLGRMEAIAPGSIVQTVKNAAEQGVHTSVEQVVVQGLSTIGDNGIHKLVADKDQSLIEGVAESAQIAAIVGGALGIGGAFAANPNSRAALSERLRTSTPEELDAFIGKHSGRATHDEIQDFIRQKDAADAAATQSGAQSTEPPPPDNRVKENNFPGDAPLSPESNTPPPTNPTQDRRQAESPPAEAQPEARNKGGASNFSEPDRAAEDAILRAMHYDDEDIADMSPGERAKRLKEAQQAGVTPEGAQKATPAADEALGTDSAPAESGTQEPKLPPGFTFDDEPAAPVDIKVNQPAPPEPSAPAEPESVKPKTSDTPRQPQTLLSFLKAAGGIKDVDGNLRAAGLHRYPGLINNKSGMDPDRAREAAAEAGYLGADRDHAHSNTTPDDLLNELQKHPTYSSFDEEQLVQWRAHTGGKAQREKDLSKAENDIHADQLEAGAPKHLIDDHFVREGARLHVDEGVPLQDAYEQAVMRDVREHIGDDKAKELDAEIPWDNYEAPEKNAEGTDGQGAKGGDTAAAPGESTEVGGAPRSGSKDGNGREESPVPPARTGSPGNRDEERPLEEAGAEGKPQLIIPGAEKIGDGQLAQRKADENLKPKVGQKDTDGLALFNDSSKQTDLLDQPAKKPEEKPDVRQAIEDAYLKASGGKYGELIGLDKIRAALPELDSATIDAALKKILASEDETATLARNDDPRRITPAEKDAAFSPHGEPFHWLTIRKPTAEPAKPSQNITENITSAADQVAASKPLAERVLDEMSKTVGQRGYLADIRKAFPDVPRAELDKALTEIHQTAENARLMRMDNPRDKRAAESNEAALDFKGEPLHYFWVNEAKGKPLDDVIADYDAKIDELLDNIAGQKTSSPFDPSKGVPDAVADHLYRGNGFPTIMAARKFVKEHGGEKLSQKAQEEAIEHGVVKTARAIVAEGHTPEETYARLVALYANQPKLSTRTSTSVEQQAYSTPAPLAYVASELAHITKDSTVLEPTAGNGMLLIAAAPGKVRANELNNDRANVLADQGFKVSRQDASTYENPNVPVKRSFDVVITNPPFGTVKDEKGNSKRFNLKEVQEGYETNEIDHAIALRSLARMKDDGHAVLILGGINKLVKGEEKRSDAYHGKAKREFFHVLYNRYNVTDHFTVAGELYEKQGAGWPVDVIAIHGRGKSARRVPSLDVPAVLHSWDELKEKLNVAQPVPAAPRPSDSRAPDVPPSASEPARPGAVDAEHSPDAGRGGPPAEQPADNGPGSVRDGRGGEKPGNAGAPGEPSEPPAIRPDGERDAGRSGEPPATGGNAGLKPAREEQETEGQSAYRPQSKTGKNLGTLVPKNMRRATEEALEKVSKSKGSIDKLVASKLGMSHNEIGAYFAAEQVDALALALHNLEKGSGFIIGDQTGIGKGRVNAAIIRYALHNKLTPIFVTEKPNLYADMYRDMVDTGMIEYLGREPKILATNSNLALALDEDGKQVLKTPDAKAHGQTLLAAAHGLPDHDMVFTTYNQMQTVKGATTVRTSALSALAPNSILILDESHNAGGTEGPVANDKMPRSVFIRSLVNNAKGVFYSSATYAKRPGVMDLYSKTDMSKAVEKPEQLAGAIASGGVPMQQVVAAMLAEAGQYIRRERSFAGVTYEAKTVPVDRKGYNAFSGAISAIQHFSETISDAVRAIDDDVKGGAAHVTSDGSTGGAGAHSTNFTAIMHNLVNQLLLAQKAEPAVRMAIEALKNGSKPVLTVANTMESFLQEYVADHKIAPNNPVKLGFNDLLHRYLERTRTITIKQPFTKGPGEKHYLTDKELGPEGVRRYKDAQAVIKKANLGPLPISPIDYMRDELARAGYKVAEITGRGSGISYADPETPRYYIRPGKETSINGRRSAIKAFNAGDADAMILNQAGATGLSLHASEKVKDQRRRHMILVQPEGNIDTHMQMLGRVHRTGQVITPEYSQLVADIPAEKRPAAVLAKKMASLNASTTAARKGALTAENVTDFMNKYGDEVAYNIMAENPDINRMLGEPVNFGAEDQDGAMRKLTGRIPLLPVERQEELYQTLESAYHTLLDEKEAAGENALEAKRLDLDARLVSSSIVKPGAGDSPFTQPVTLEVLNVKRQSKPYFAKDLIADAAKTVELKNPDKDHAKALAAIEAAGRKHNELQVKAALDAFRPYAKMLLGDIENEATRQNTQARIDDIERRFSNIMSVASVGKQVSLLSDDQRFTGIITNVYRDGRALNPLALGTWKARVAIPGKGQVSFPFSKLYTDVKPTGRDDDTLYRLESSLPDSNVLNNFDEMSKDAREQRVMLTGNLLAAYAWNRGQIVNYTDHEGGVRQGVLLPSSVESAEDAMHGKGTPLATGREVLDLVEKTREPLASSTDSNVSIKKSGGALTISVPSAKAKGGDYYLDKQLREIGQGDFIRRGSTMQIDVPRWGDQAGAIERLMQLGAKFEKPYEKTEKSASVAHMQRLRLAENHGGRLPEDVAKVVRDALDAAGIARSVAGAHADVDITERLIPISKSVAQKSGSDKASLAFGLFSSNKSLGQRLVQIAFATGVEKRTAYHEAFHALESADVFHDAEKNVLKRETPRLRQIVQKDLKISDDELRGMPDYEIRAYAFEKWAHDTDKGDNPNTGQGLHLGIRRIFEKVKDFLRRLKNKLQGAGFQTTEDVFARARSGEMGQREAGPNAYNIRSNLGTEGTFTAAAIPHNGRHFNREPAIDRIKRKIANAVDPASAEESLLDLSARLRRMQVELAAGGHPVRPSTDAYMAKRLMPGKIEARKDDFDREYVKPLAAQMKAAGLTLQDLDEYVASEHIPERNARMDQVDPNNNGRGSGFSDADAQAIRARLSAEGKIPALISAAHYVAGMREFELKTLEDAGLISQDQADALRGMYQHYVPFKGWEDPDNIPEGAIWGTGPGARMSVKGPEYHHAFGRTTSSDSPVANLINQTYRAITRAERNDSVNTLYRLLKSLPKATRDTIAILDKGPKMKVLDESTGQMRWVTEPNWYKGEDVVSLKIAGNMHRIRFHDEALAQGINRLHPDQLPNWLRPVGAFINLEKSLWTHWNPDFVLRHFFMRYPTETFLNAREHGIGAMFKTLKGYPGGRAFRAILAADKMTSAERAQLAHKVASGNASEAEEWQHLYHRYRDAGGLMRFSDIAGVERIKKKLDSALARLDRNPLHAAMAGARAGYDAIDHMTNVLDNANRLAVFVHAVKNGATDKEAAFRAREASVDFALKGTAQKIINIWWPFGNTAAQTASRSVRGIKRSSAYRQAIYGMMALGAAQALYNYMVGGEDKDGTPFFEKIAPWTRRLNSVMMLPAKDSEGRPYRMTWSLPYFFAMPHTAGAAMMQLALKAMGVAKESTGEILHNVMHSALEALTPMSQEDTLAGKFTPEPGRGILHAYLNQNFAGRSLYTEHPKAGLARSEQGKENTGSAWKGIASFANKATGGDRYHRGFADMYPEAWKEIFGGPTSAVERLTGHVASAIDDVAHGRAPNVDDIPVARTLISGDHSYDQADTARFYKERNEASAADDAYKQARKNGDHAVADRMMEDNGDQIRSAARYRAASKQVNALYKELDRVKKDDKMPAAEKDKEEQRIQKRQLEIMRGAEAH